MKNNTIFFSPIVLLAIAITWLIAFPAPVSAAQAILQWDANDPAPAGYKLFLRQEGDAYDYTAPVWQGADNTCEVMDLTPGVSYYFVVRAFQDSDDESADSNEVQYTPAGGSTTNSFGTNTTGTADTPTDAGGSGCFIETSASPAWGNWTLGALLVLLSAIIPLFWKRHFSRQSHEYEQ
jgi:hypothetical protein